jgi:nitroreductase
MTRDFDGGPAHDDVLAMCDLARRAPSAGFSQGSHFLVLEGPDKEDFFQVSGAGAWFARRAPGVPRCSHLVLVLGDPSAYTDRYSAPDKIEVGLSHREAWSCPYWLTDAAMAAQNLLLLCEERGWGALFFGLPTDPRATLTHYGVPEHVEIVGIIALGYRSSSDAPSGSPTRRGRRPSHEVIHVGRWG